MCQEELRDVDNIYAAYSSRKFEGNMDMLRSRTLTKHRPDDKREAREKLLRISVTARVRNADKKITYISCHHYARHDSLIKNGVNVYATVPITKITSTTRIHYR